MTNALKTELANLYLDYLNHFLTMEAFAEYYEISVMQAASLLTLGREYHEERAKK